MRTTRSGSENGRSRRKRSCIKLKMAVFIPIPIASISAARQLKAGVFRSCRSAKRISSNIEVSQPFGLFITQRDHWIDACGATRWNKTGNRRDERKHSGNRKINRRIEGVYFEKNIFERCRCDYPE